MEFYNLPAPDYFKIEDLLDFSNADLFSFSTTAAHDSNQNELLTGNNNTFPQAFTKTTTADIVPNFSSSSNLANNNNHSSTFSDEFCVHNDDAAELEWLSKFVDDSFTDIPTATTNFPTAAATNFTTFITTPPTPAVPGKARSKRSRIARWISSPDSPPPTRHSPSSSSTSSTSEGGVQRKCTHCASEKTPQWRTGPRGPKTLCNACGVRYKSGRLVPEYRPAASPSFVLTQHSNSHRKVLELRRQKEEMSSNLMAVHIRHHNGAGDGNNVNGNRHEYFHRHQHRDFEVC